MIYPQWRGQPVGRGAPLLPLRVLADRDRVGALLAVATATVGMLGMFLFMAFHLQTVLHYSSLRAGMAFLPYVAAAITATQVSRRLLPWVRPRAIVAPGLVLASSSMRLLDLGAGTGSWARTFTNWFPRIDVIAVEPSAAMRAPSVFEPILADDAAHIPLADECVDAAWISTVITTSPT